MRETKLVIKDIKELIKSKGYIYSLCLILFEDFHIDVEKSHEIDYRKRISVKEASLLLGFLIQNKLDFTTPKSWQDLIQLKKRTYELLEELHESFMMPFYEGLKKEIDKKEKNRAAIPDQKEFFNKGSMLTEPIFYSGTGVYDIQYLEFLEKKYKYDKKWLLENKQFDLHKTPKIVLKIKEILQEKSKKVNLYGLTENMPQKIEEMKKKYPERDCEKEAEEVLPMLELYQYVNLFVKDLEDKKVDIKNIREESWKSFYKNLIDLFVVKLSDFDEDVEIKSFMNNFSIIPTDELNANFQTIGDYNMINSHPIIDMGDKEYFVPITFLLAEAVYESPFYWMNENKEYKDLAGENRGKVGEEIVYDLVSNVFGKDKTFKSVKVATKKGKDDTDIDVLCILGSKALCIQIKSKRLTQLSRKGDDNALISDFQKAVQDAYNQGVISRQKILERDAKFIDKDGATLKISEEINEVYIMGITTENYPSLTHQSDVMLDKKEDEPFPLILTIFDLELIAHYLNDPYDLLYYIKQRISLLDYYKAEEEIIFLGLHLTQKLWRRNKVDGELIDPSFGQVIDRNYYPYKLGLNVTDEGDAIKSRWKNIEFEKICNELKELNEPKITDTLFNLFDLSGETRDNLIKFMMNAKKKTSDDGNNHNFSIPPHESESYQAGITYVSLNSNDKDELKKYLLTLSLTRKYRSKGNVWIGFGSLKSSTRMTDSIFYINQDWEYDKGLEEASKILEATGKGRVIQLGKKVGRNEKCPCGSGLKYKKCCLVI